MDQNELRICISESVTGVFWGGRIRFLNKALAAKAIVAVKAEVVQLPIVLDTRISFRLFEVLAQNSP
jgi:hypothetical protein